MCFGGVDLDFAAVEAGGDTAIAEGGEATDLVVDGGGDGDVLEGVVVVPVGGIGGGGGGRRDGTGSGRLGEGRGFGGLPVVVGDGEGEGFCVFGAEVEFGVFDDSFVRGEGGFSLGAQVEDEGGGDVLNLEMAGEGAGGGVGGEVFVDLDGADAVGEYGVLIDEVVAEEFGFSGEGEEGGGGFAVVGLVGKGGGAPHAEEVCFGAEVGVAEAAGFGVPAGGEAVFENDGDRGGGGVGHGGAGDVGEGAFGFLEGGKE